MNHINRIVKKYFPHALLIALTFVIVGCAGWRQERTAAPIADMPERFINAPPAGEYLDGEWWKLFNDPVLDQLIDTAFDSNLTILAAAARLDQYQALANASQASWFPTLTFGLTASESGPIGDPAPAPGVLLNPTAPSYKPSLTAVYELDLWGKLKAGRSAAYADLLANREDLRAVVLATTTTIARVYYTIIELQQQAELLDRTVATYSANLNIITGRYNLGVSSAVDLYQAEANLAGARMQRSTVEQNLATVEHSLSVLLGRYPQRGTIGKGTEFPLKAEVHINSIPGELIQQRPDVQASYQRLKATDNRVAEATARFFPTITLTGVIGGSGNELATAFDPDNMLWNLIGGLTAPVFQGGRIKAGYDQAEAVWRGQLAQHKAVTLKAFQEVEDAIVRSNLQVDIVQALTDQVTASHSALQMSTDRYLQGVTDYLPVVVGQASYLNAERSLITAKRQLVESRIGLAGTVGGSWLDRSAERAIKAGRSEGNNQ